MCLGIPGKVIEKKGNVAKIDFGGLIREANVSLVNAKVGDYVIVHAGFAISKVNKREALKTIKLVKEIIESKV
ncbi:MAG: HypC/HybG/HupF family hydrogenase formation chaperone [Nitrososphaeria archaeon]|nr:HypC/HybG/HupF family hydrogenase formation chaperone [Nitrososphaeria archaeon]